MSAQPRSQVGSKPPVSPIIKIETQYRKFLGKRYLAFISRSALWTSLVFTSSVAFKTGSLNSSLLALLASVPVFIALALVLKFRKAYITQPYTPPSQSTLINLFFSSFWNERAITLLFAYAIFSLTTSNLWCAIVEKDGNLALFSPTTRHHWQLNERRVVISAANLVLSLILAGRDILGDRLKAVWPEKKAVQAALFDDFSTLFSSTGALSLTLLWSATIPFVYRIVLRNWIWSWVNWRLWGVFLRPFLGSFARVSSRAPSAWSLAPQLLLLDLVTLSILEIPLKGLMPYITQPLHFDDFFRKSPLSPDRYLITALKSQNPYYLHFTLMELLRIVNIPSRRKALFDDISKSPSLTLELWQELLLQLGNVNYNLSTRGAVAKPSTIPASASVSSRSTPDLRAIPIKQGDIFRPVARQKSTFGLRSVLDGPIRTTPPEPVVKVGQVSALAVKHVEEIEKKVVGRIEATPYGKEVVVGAQGWVGQAYDWAGQEWARRKVRAAIPDLLIAKQIIEIFTVLAVYSVDEDTYGHVQQVLPATLEAIVRFRSTVAGFEAELAYAAGSLGKAQNAAAGQAQASLIIAKNACDKSVRRIGEKFGPSLGAFRFPPSIAQALGDIVKAQ